MQIGLIIEALLLQTVTSVWQTVVVIVDNGYWCGSVIIRRKCAFTCEAIWNEDT